MNVVPILREMHKHRIIAHWKICKRNIFYIRLELHVIYLWIILTRRHLELNNNLDLVYQIKHESIIDSFNILIIRRLIVEHNHRIHWICNKLGCWELCYRNSFVHFQIIHGNCNRNRICIRNCLFHKLCLCDVTTIIMCCKDKAYNSCINRDFRV